MRRISLAISRSAWYSEKRLRPADPKRARIVILAPSQVALRATTHLYFSIRRVRSNPWRSNIESTPLNRNEPETLRFCVSSR
jgi:hypothetical protein